MKTIKPQKVSVLHRTFEAAGSLNLCVTVMVGSPFGAPQSPVHEATLWKMLAAELGKDVAPDACMPKPRSEVLVNARAYPRGGARPACSVRLAIGPIDKTLWVAGDRTWDRTGAASDPAPFTEMAITWANAFGGPGFGANPVGKGFAPIKGEAGETHPLPNIEDPKRLLRAPRDRPPPAGFGPFDLTWPERYASTGTYDDAWLQNQFPGLPLDFDFAFYNTAPLDQRLDGHFRGDEAFTLENMHPGKPVLEGRLPGLLSRVFVSLRSGELREVPMRLDTVQLFPGVEQMVVIFRGLTRVTEDDASDVLQLVAACEALGAPRSVEHYKGVLAERLDKKRGALASLRDTDLMPPGPGASVALAEIADPDLAAPIELLKSKNMHSRLDHELAQGRARIAAMGLDPDEHLPLAPRPEPDATPPSLDELEAIVTQAKAEGARAMADAEAKRERAETQARERCQEAGLDYDKAVAEQQKKQGGPPTFSAAVELQKLRDAQQLAANAGVKLPALEAQLQDPELRRRLQTAEDGLRDMYRKHAHQMPAAQAAAASFSERARIELPAGAGGGVSFAGRDLTGVDLSGLDLRGVDLSSAFLEGASLAGSNLTGADLTRAVLTRADLTGADLTGARLAGCNLGRAVLAGAKLLGGIDLTRAVLAGADLTGASFCGARLDRVDLAEATFRDTDFTGVVGVNINFMSSDLRGLKLAGASFVKCNFIEVDLSGVDLTGADLSSAAFVSVKADGAVLRGARLVKLRAVRETSFEGADFTEAVLTSANLRQCRLAGCDFTRAELGGADLSECDLRRARFYRATGREARFTKADLSQAVFTGANLMCALLDRAKVHGTSFLGANLFRADLAKVDVDGATVMKDANMTQMRFVQARGTRGAS